MQWHNLQSVMSKSSPSAKEPTPTATATHACCLLLSPACAENQRAKLRDRTPSDFCLNAFEGAQSQQPRPGLLKPLCLNMKPTVGVGEEKVSNCWDKTGKRAFFREITKRHAHVLSCGWCCSLLLAAQVRRLSIRKGAKVCSSRCCLLNYFHGVFGL